MSDQRMQVVFLGRIFGTASGWDAPFDNTLQFWDFVPDSKVPLPAAEVVTILYDEGIIEYYDSEGNVTSSHDIVEFLSTNTLDMAPRER